MGSLKKFQSIWSRRLAAYREHIYEFLIYCTGESTMHIFKNLRGGAFPWVLGRLVGWIFYLVKRLTVCCFFCWRVQINLNGDLLWFGVSPRGVSVKTTYGRGGLEVVFMVNNIAQSLSLSSTL